MGCERERVEIADAGGRVVQVLLVIRTDAGVAVLDEKSLHVLRANFA